jgi:hypothetical protein
MNDKAYMQLAISIRALVPDFPMSAFKIKAALKKRGLDRFAQENCKVAELAEIAELLLRMEKRGALYE